MQTKRSTRTAEIYLFLFISKYGLLHVIWVWFEVEVIQLCFAKFLLNRGCPVSISDVRSRGSLSNADIF